MAKRRKDEPEELARKGSSPAFYYDIIVSSPEIKKLILHRIKVLDVDLKLVLKEAGIKEWAFKKRYLRHPDPVSTPALRQSHIISLLEVLGVKLKIQLVAEKDLTKIKTDHLKFNNER